MSDFARQIGPIARRIGNMFARGIVSSSNAAPKMQTLQLRLLPRSEAQMVAIIVCKSHLELLARRDLKKLCAVTGADEDMLRDAQALIVALEPKPGRQFARAEANIIIAAAPVEIFSDPDFGASPVGAGEEAGVFSDDMFFP